jgi:hypothetical protein
MDRKSAARLGGLQKGINYRKQKHKALYSEPQVDKAYLNFEPPEKPQVCPKAEQMICPKIGACQHPIPRFCGHDKPHVTKINCANTAGNCPACIPVPSTPASVFPHKPDAACDIGFNCPTCIPVPSTPDELLTGLREEIAKELRKSFCEMHCRNDKSNKNCQFRFDCEDIYKPADAILLKCHQSESAEIEEQLTEIVCSQYTRAEKAEAKIKELKGLTDSLQDKIEAIRADQNKKIGEWLKKQEHNDFIDGTGRETYHVEVFESDIAKLQKGELDSK